MIPTQNHCSHLYVSDVTDIFLPLSISQAQKGLFKRKSLCKEFKEELTGTSNPLVNFSVEAITRTKATNQCPHRCKQILLCLLGIPAFSTYDETKYLKNLILQLDTKQNNAMAFSATYFNINFKYHYSKPFTYGNTWAWVVPEESCRSR